MRNIWGFLIQTLEVSLLAILLLILKHLLKDKLSPRWQYGIWSILILSILLPAGLFGTYLIPLLDVFIEAVKTICESHLHSSYTQAYVAVINTSVFPYFTSFPSSITDALFVIYAAGILSGMIKYLKDYLSLKKLLHKAEPVNERVKKQIGDVAHRYQLSPCKAVVVEGLSSAFVFGIFKPVLVLPQEEIDDKILLHELLHVRYKDSLQNVIWSILKCLHWCNPLLHYVFHTISNDLEALCDQRVLEHIQGEERRDYGRILLAMTNEKYPHAFATTSISNGAGQIKKRIEAITRFKKYPKGMGLVSVCIGILLLPLVLGSGSSVTMIEANTSDFGQQLSLASTRLMTMPSVAGAIDYYAKGLLTNNDAYIMAVMPSSLQSEYLSVLDDLPEVSISYPNEALYRVLNLKETADHVIEGFLVFTNDSNDFITSTYVPIKLTKEIGWKVQQNGKVEQYELDRSDPFSQIRNIHWDAPAYGTYHMELENGETDISVHRTYIVQNETDYFNMGFYSTKPNANAIFERSYQTMKIKYTYTGDDFDYYRIESAMVDKADKDVVRYPTCPQNPCTFIGSDGSIRAYAIDENWDRTIEMYHTSDVHESSSEIEMGLPDIFDYRVRINWETVEEVILDLKEDHYE